MNFHRSKALACVAADVGRAAHVRRAWIPAPWSVALIVLHAGLSFGQNSWSPSRATPTFTATEISQYLVAREDKPFNFRSKGSAPLSADAIIEKMMAASALRAAELRGFQGKRWYHLRYHGFLGGREASMEVLATYSAPDRREYSVVSQSGSKLLLNRVLLKLLESEKQAFENRKQIDLTPANYKFALVGTERVPEGNMCYVLSVMPRKENPFLYAGKIWVDANEFAVTRMEGQPTKSPSFWIRDTQIESRWQRFGNFWFIAHNSSVSHIRMGGLATLTIDYGDYKVTEVDHRAARNQGQAPILPDPASVTPQH